MTWTCNSWVFVNALRKAHNRGVSVRIIMARTLANEQGLVIRRDAVEEAFGRQISRLSNIHLRSARPIDERFRVSNPYMNMDK